MAITPKPIDLRPAALSSGLLDNIDLIIPKPKAIRATTNSELYTPVEICLKAITILLRLDPSYMLIKELMRVFL